MSTLSNYLNNVSGPLNFATGTAIASAATVNLDTATGNRVHITGSTTITAITLTRGPRTVIFDGVLTLTHNATTNNLPGAANITTAVGDRAIYESDGTTVYCVSYIRVSGIPVVIGIVQIPSRRAFITSSTTHTIPAGVTVARPYAVGAGAAGVAATSSGAGGGMAYGDIAVIAGDVLTINIAAGIATVIKGGVTMLTANAASGVTAGTASKNAAVTNGGAFSGGAGFAGSNASGGASSGSPLGVGVASTNSGGTSSAGSGWGGAGAVSGGGGGVGGAGTSAFGGPGLTVPSFDPLLVGLEGLGGSTGNPGQLGAGGGPSAGGGFGGGGGIGNTRGGFGGGGGGVGGSVGGDGGFGGGGGQGNPAGAGGASAVLIFY